MNQKQMIGTYLPMRRNFKAGVVTARLYQVTYPFGEGKYLTGEDHEFFCKNAHRIAYLLKSSGIPVAYQMVNGEWVYPAPVYGKTYARHQAYIRSIVEWDERRKSA